MAKASPLVRSFNAGEFSELMEGRTDLDRYPASARSVLNTIAAPQGPALSRSGTAFVSPVADHAKKSVLVPFIFSDEQAKMLEFADDRIRFIDEGGVQVYTPVAFTTLTTAPFVITSATLGANVGDEVLLSGYPANYNLNGEIARITAKAGNDYTLNLAHPALAGMAGTVARLYHIAQTFTEAQRDTLWATQSVDVMYLFTGAKPRKLSRYGAYDWRLEDVTFIDGPFMPINETGTTLTPNQTGNAIANMTADIAPAPLVASASTNRPFFNGAAAGDQKFLERILNYDLAASSAYYAFNDNDEQYWAANIEQKGHVQIDFGVATSIDGYTIYTARDNQDTTYIAKDYAPGSFQFLGSNDGVAWTTIDEQEDYVLYQNAKSVFVELEAAVNFRYYRLNIIKLFRNGSIEPRVRRLVFRGTAAKSITFTASSTVGINKDQGFQTTDVGRLLRVKGSDNFWRALRITSRASTTVVTATLEGEPLPNLKAIKQWRLGYWSDTTGWPTCSTFFDDRLVAAGSLEFPDMYAMSVIGAYETFSQTDATATVLDDSAVVARLNARRLSRIRWLEEDEKGLLLGTGSGEYLLTSAKGEAELINARNIKARNSTSRGSADVKPVKVDRQVLYVQRSGRTMREFAWVYEADGYKSPSMSQLASHLGVKRFVEMDYAAEPHGIVWVRREDGSVVGLTYNRDENVVGWHRHDFDGIVESLAVMPQTDQTQDTLWMVIRRTVNGQQKRYIEYLTRTWDFDMTLADAHFVDSGLRYSGAPITVVYGLQHLEGRAVYGIANFIPFGPKTVTNGSITLDAAASNIVVGIGYDSEVEISRLENGAADGTALGKTGRINNISLLTWRSWGGEVGVWDDEAYSDADPARPLGAYKFSPVEYPRPAHILEEVQLYTGEVGPMIPAPSNSKRKTIKFRRPKSSPLPFNVAAIMPQMNTQDR